jgi:DNA-binding beta-propeller fold protein YncE
MKRQRGWQAATGVVLAASLLGLAGLARGRKPTGTHTLRLVAKIDLPGPKGKRFDYLTIDPDDHYLLIAHLAAAELDVVDLGTNRVVKAVEDVPGVEGVEYVPGFGKIYTSDWWENKIGVIDARTLQITKKLPTEAKPDGSAYAAGFGKLYVSDERGRAEAVVDVKSDQIVRTLYFPSETGMPQYDPVAKKVYVNLQDEDVFAVIDPANDEIVGKYPVAGCRGNHGMALDPEHHRAFLSCEGNDTLTVFDLDRHAAIAHLPMAAGPDVVKFDPGLARIYVACSSGFISVFHEDDPKHFRKLEDFPVERKVHSLAVDPTTHRVYAPEEQENGQPASRLAIYQAVSAPIK